MVESLTSYTIRLANAHNLPIRAFVSEVMAPRTQLATVAGAHNAFDLLGAAGSAANGMGQISSECCRILTELTYQPRLSELSMQFAGGTLSPRGLLSPSQCWCANCLTEMEAEDRVIYYPLVWHLEPVEAEEEFSKRTQTQLQPDPLEAPSVA